MTTTWAIDATHDQAHNVPLDVPLVVGYESGTPDIEWTSSDWLRFAGRAISNYQGYGYTGALSPDQLEMCDEIDVEARALTPAQAADIIEQRVKAGWQWTTVYGSDSTIGQVATAVQAKGHEIWIGHVLCRLANWNLNQTQAAALVGTSIHGITCVGVQWASPTSNPHTVVPGTAMALDQADVDLSEVATNWLALVSQRIPSAPPPATRTGILVELPDGPAITVHSTDGRTWS